MFDLPYGTPVKEDFDLTPGSILPFEYGSISTYIGRRKTPSGHRLVRAGRIVGWIAEPADGKALLSGKEASARLEVLEESGHHHVTRQWTKSALGAVAECVPEAFEHRADMRGLLGAGSSLERLLSRDLSAVLNKISQRPEVKGGIAVDQGMLIDSIGDLPGDAEKLAVQIGNTIESRTSMMNSMLTGGNGHWSIQTEDGALMIAESGDITLAIWTEADVDHAGLINKISALMDGEISVMGSGGEALSEGHILREGRGGTDAVISMLNTAIEEGLTGHLSAGKSSKAIRIALNNGVPVAIQAPKGHKLASAVNNLTESKRILTLHRLPVGSIIGPDSGNVSDYSLDDFCSEISHTRTRSEARQAFIKKQMEEMYGFEIGIELLKVERSKSLFALETVEVSKGLDIEQPNTAVDDGLRRKLEKAVLQISELEGDLAATRTALDSSKAAEQAAKVDAREANLQASDIQNNISASNSALNQMQLDLAAAQVIAENSESRSDRLSRRVNELEHQLSERAGELAKALGNSKSSTELSVKIEEMANTEAALSSDIASHSQTLASIRSRIEDDQRRQRMIEEQVEATRERHRKAQSQLSELESRINDSQLSLRQIEAEAKVSRARTQEDRDRLSEQENRAAMIHSEMRELMDERRQVLKELGDLGARRGQAEAELSLLLDQAEALAEAHEEAIADIGEAERLRAKLSQEPLAQALLEDEAQFEGLGPVLDRLEHSRTLGYSVSLLDRAVERALQVIQATVDHVATTPRHLLSNEVMTLLERQVPATAGAVRGLARWSVQQRLEHQLGETVSSLVLDLEGILEDYDRSITMLRRIRNVLEQLEKLGAPSEQIQALLSNTRRPESLPVLARETRMLIQKALDDIHIESDMRDAGSAVRLEATTTALDELLQQLDASGLIGGEVRGALWDFKREGILPFERDSVPLGERAPVHEQTLEQLKGELIDQEKAITAEDKDITEEWETMSTPIDEASGTEAEAVEQMEPISLDDERASLEEELARLDVRWARRSEPKPEPSASDEALDDLEDELDGIDL